MSPFEPRRARRDVERFCPYHGGWIKLADCQIVATSDRYNQDNTRQHGAAPEEPRRNARARDVMDWLEPDKTAPPQVSDEPQTRRTIRVAADIEVSAGTLLSEVDGRRRVVLAGAVGVPPPVPKGRRGRSALSDHDKYLRLPAEVARGGPRFRPARACPVCRHPLPRTIDYRDPFPVAIVGHAEASKTTSIVGLIEGVSEHGPEALGVSAFSPTEATVRYLASLGKGDDPDAQDVFELYRERQPIGRTQRGRHGYNLKNDLPPPPPLEFVTTLPRTGDEAALMLQDVSGEDLMDPETRGLNAPMLYWADVIVFIYNPEDSRSRREKRRLDQAVLLNALREDLEARGPRDSAGREYPEPELIVVVSKMDLLDRPPDIRSGPAPEAAVRAALSELDDRGVVAAAERFHHVHWRFMAPCPEDQSEPQGVMELFRLVLSVIDS